MKSVLAVGVPALLLAGCSNAGFGSALSGLPATGMPPPDFSPVAADTDAAQVARNLNRLDDRIDAARNSGDISRREARGLRKEARVIDALASRYAADGLSQDEVRELETRARVLESQAEATRWISNDKEKPD